MNPFRNRIVTDPWHRGGTDIYEINKGAFEQCREAFELVRSEKRGFSVLLHGVPGSGKTHLLARLRKHLDHLRSVYREKHVNVHVGEDGSKLIEHRDQLLQSRMAELERKLEHMSRMLERLLETTER